MRTRNTDERSEAQKAYHLEQISELYFKLGKKQVEVARMLNISQATVSRDVQKLKRRLLMKARLNVEKWQAEALGELQTVKAEAWAGWERSQQNKEVRTEQTAADGKKTVILKTEGQAGDPRFLSVVTGAVQEEMKIVGGETATRLRFGDGDDGGVPIINITLQEVPARAAADVDDVDNDDAEND